MGNKYFVPGQNRASRVRELFNRIAPRYDLINDLQSAGLHRHWKSCLTRWAAVRAKDKVLDVCCGTGDLALALQSSGAEVVGLDFSEPMLVQALQRSPAHSRLTWIKGDALHLPFPSQVFDVVTIAYGLRNLADWKSGLDEMWRVLGPGGRLLILDFSQPTSSLWRAVYLGYLKWIIPKFGQLFCGDPETHGYILESLKHYPAPEKISEYLRSLGAKTVQLRLFGGGIMSLHRADKG